jgi:uncharacterized protein involved in exopolysaccharide biosynthesis
VSEQFLTTTQPGSSISAKDILAIGFRHKQLMAISFLSVVLGAILVAMFWPSSYEAHTKLLVSKERFDPVVTPGHENSVALSEDVKVEELNSEAELLQSDDVLRQVVLANGLQNRRCLVCDLVDLAEHLTFKGFTQEGRIDAAVDRLRSNLKIEAVKNSDVLSVTYASSNPQGAAKVLKTLGDVYIQKNAEIHRPQGEYKFFAQEAERYKQELNQAEEQLKEFASQQGGVAPTVARDNALQKLAEFNATLQTTRADMAATEKRIHTLETQLSTVPSRITTQLRNSDDAQLEEHYKATLMNLELKRTELLTKFQPTYPLVQEVNKEIADTQASIAAEESKPLREQTTDQNPTYQYVDTELAKERAQFSSLQAREAATQAIVDRYHAQVEQLEKMGIVQQHLLRVQKTDEDNYLLYSKKSEEARISDALDQKRILNVAVAEQPVVPTLPAHSPWLIIGLGVVLAIVTSSGLALTADGLDPSFRTPAEVSDELNIPVLAAVPYRYALTNGNGNGNGRHNGNGSYPGTAEDSIVSEGNEGTLGQ